MLSNEKKRHKLSTSEAESTNAAHCRGLSRSCDEVSVMEMERRA